MSIRLLQLIALAGLACTALAAHGGAASEADAVADAVADAPWRLEKEADGISVWTRPVDGSRHRAIRARMVVDSPIEALVAIIRDTKACREWAQFCAESHVHESLSPEEAYIYTLNDLPWPVADRDVLSHVTWTVDAETGQVDMEAVATEGILEPQGRNVRLTDARSHWTLRPLQDGTVEVTTFAHVDPAGPVPAWITNRLLVDAPYRTMQQLRDLGASGRYAEGDPSFPIPGAR